MAKLSGDSWRGNFGVRAVHTETTSQQYSTTVADRPIASIFAPPVTDSTGAVTDPGGYGIAESKNTYWDILPSMNISYDASDDVVFRASAARVMTRPGYAQLAGFVSLVDANFTGSAGGNPYLEPFRANQYNLGVEWYYAPQALFSFNIFKMDIENYIKTESFTAFYRTVQTPNGHDFLMSGPVNGGDGKDNGFEISWQQPLFGGFGVIANYTYSNGVDAAGDPIDGNSENTYNLTGYFENSKVSTRLAYNFRSKFKSGTDRGTPMWQDDFGTLDGSFSYNLNDHIALTLDAQNLLHEKLTYFVGSPQVPRAIYDNGQSFYIGARLKY
jgi:iron complex outermembrane receptor protein